MGLSFSSRPVYEDFNSDARVGYSGNGDETGDISGDDGDERGDKSGENVRCEYRSQEIIQYSPRNRGEIVDVDKRCGYRYHTSHSSYHNPYDRGSLLCLYVSYIHVNESVHGDERGDSGGDDGRRGYRYQYISQYSFKNNIESVDVDGRGIYMFQTSPYISHNLGELSRLMGFSVHVYERSVNRSHTTQLPSYNHGVL